MRSPAVLSFAAQVAVVAIVLLGLFGGSLIVAHSGFSTSPRHGGLSTFVPAPQAYLLAATMYGMSIIGMLVLLRGRIQSRIATVFAVALYTVVAMLLAKVLAPA
jgi:hypothetical protein